MIDGPKWRSTHSTPTYHIVELEAMIWRVDVCCVMRSMTRWGGVFLDQPMNFTGIVSTEAMKCRMWIDQLDLKMTKYVGKAWKTNVLVDDEK